MKKTIKLDNKTSIEAEVKTPEEIAEMGAPIVAVCAKGALQPYDEHYVPGTKAGFPCSLCGQDCILAPSGQHQYSFGKNPIFCDECTIKLWEAKGDS